MEVSQIWILNIEVVLLQVVAELHGGVGAEGTFWTVVHLHALMFAGVEDVLPDVLRTVGSVAAVKTGSGINMTSVRAHTHTHRLLSGAHGAAMFGVSKHFFHKYASTKQATNRREAFTKTTCCRKVYTRPIFIVCHAHKHT